MADPKKESVLARRARAPEDDLPRMLERLATDVTTLFDQKLALLKIEVKEDVEAYVRGAVIILAGGIVAAVGFALANTALAFAVSTFFTDLNITQPAKYALGFIVTGLVYLLIGVVLIFWTRNKLAKQGIVPRRTVNELERDKEWLQNEL